MPYNLHNSPIVTVYMYLLVFAVFFLFYQDSARNNQLTLLSDLHDRGADRFTKFAFVVVLLTFLGTPVTLGFAYKLIVFNNISASSWTLAPAAAINLIMLIFYLQAARHPQLSRKKKASRSPTGRDVSSKSAAVFGCVLTALALIVAPLILDILSSVTA